MSQIPDKPTIDEAMAHFGIMGMHWGSRKNTASSSNGKTKSKSTKPPKPTTAQIESARYSQGIRLRKAQEAQGNFMVARGAKGKNAAEKIMRNREKDLFTNPDAKTAALMTKGEKIATGIGLGALTIMTMSIAANSVR